MLDEEQESQFWFAATQLLSSSTLQELVAGLAEPPLLASESCGANWLPLSYIPAELLPLLAPYTLERERSRHWLWDGAGPGIYLPEGLIERLTNRLAAALQE